MADSFGALGQIEAGGALSIARSTRLGRETDVTRLPYTLRVLLENVLRSEALGHGSPDEVRPSRVGGEDRAPTRFPSAEPRAAPGLHGRSRGRRSGCDARGDEGDRRRPAEDQSAGAGGARHRSLGAGRRVRHEGRAAQECRARVRAQPRALRVLKWGQTAFDNFSVVPPETGIVHQVNLEYLARVVRRATQGGRPFAFPGHAGRDRLAHDDDQRAGRPGLGRRWHRSRGRDARPAGLHAPPSRRRIAAHRRAARGRHRDGPRAHGDADAPRSRCRRQVRRVLRPRAGRAAARGPRDDREHGAGVRSDVRLLPGRRRDDSYLRSPAGARSRSRSWRRTAKAGTLRAIPTQTPEYSQMLELDLGDGRASLGRAARRRIASPCARRSRLPEGALDLRRRTGRLAGQGVAARSASDPASTGAGHRRETDDEDPSRSPSRTGRERRSRHVATSSTWSTARSSSRRSRGARTPRIRPS